MTGNQVKVNLAQFAHSWPCSPVVLSHKNRHNISSTIKSIRKSKATEHGAKITGKISSISGVFFSRLEGEEGMFGGGLTPSSNSITSKNRGPEEISYFGKAQKIGAGNVEHRRECWTKCQSR